MSILETELRRQFHLRDVPTGLPLVRIYRENDPLREVLFRPGAPPVAQDDVYGLGGHHPQNARGAQWWDALADRGADAYREQAEDALRSAVPSWIAVPDSDPTHSPAAAQGREIAREVHGRLVECRQSPEDLPLVPWHYWYDWGFNVHPEAPYRYLLNVNPQAGRPDTPDRHMHCEWDTGATWRGGPGQPWNHAGVMFSEDVPEDLPARFRWIWPMESWHVWLAGRWIYDVGHAPYDLRTPHAAGYGLAAAELHPCMAMATVHSEGVRFSDGHFRPAVEVVLFASRFGGYRDFPGDADNWGGRDLDFLVQLPPRPASASPAPVSSAEAGASPQQTIAARPLQPELIVRFENVRARLARGRVGPNRGDGGVWEFTTPNEALDDAAELPTVHPIRQARTPVPPGTNLTDHVLLHVPREVFANVDSYGVHVAVAWHDPAQEAELYEVTVTLNSLAPYARKMVGGRQEWAAAAKTFFLRFAINGRWFQRIVPAATLPSDRRVVVEQTVQLRLHPRDAVEIQIDGMVATKSVDQRALGALAAAGPDSVHGVLELDVTSRTPDAGRPLQPVTWAMVEGTVRPGGVQATVEEITAAMRAMMESTLKNENIYLPVYRLDHPMSELLAPLAAAQTPAPRVVTGDRDLASRQSRVVGWGQSAVDFRTGYGFTYTITVTPHAP